MQNILWDPNSNPPKRNYSASPKPTHTRKILLLLGNKMFLHTEIYRNIQTFAFKVLQECSSWASRNGAVQCFFLTTNRNIFSGKTSKSERLLAFCGSILFSMSSESNFVKWVRLFERNCIVKWVIFLAGFCLAEFENFC